MEALAGAEGRQVVVVGGGLAGMLAAARQIEAGARVLMYDVPEPESASRIAAGLYNPITGKRWALSWQYRALHASLMAFFSTPAYAALLPYLHPMPLYRAFPSVQELNEWSSKARQPVYADYTEVEMGGYQPQTLVNPHGGLLILQGGWLEVAPFLQGLTRCLLQTGRFTLLQRRFDYADLEPATGLLHIGGLRQVADRVIFCEGSAYRQNPWWVWRELPLLKGQLLRVSIPGLALTRILTSPIYLIPLADDQYLVGATYEPRFAHTLPDEAGKAELLDKLYRVLPGVPVEVLAHRAALRPTGPQGRRPCLGPHPQWPRLWFFNALGTKGVLLAPHFAEVLARWMWTPGYSPEPEVDIRRLQA